MRRPAFVSSRGRRIKLSSSLHRSRALADARCTLDVNSWSNTILTLQNESAVAVPKYFLNQPNRITLAMGGNPDSMPLLTAYNVTKGKAHVVIKNQEIKYVIENACNMQVNFRVYECVAREDPQLAQTLGTQQEGGGILANGYDTTSFTDVVAGTLYMNTEFVKAFKIIKDVKYILNPGEQKEFHLIQRNYQDFKLDDLYHIGSSGVTPDLSFPKSWTKKSRFLVFQQWGTVESDPATTASAISATRTTMVASTTLNLQVWQPRGVDLILVNNMVDFENGRHINEHTELRENYIQA